MSARSHEKAEFLRGTLDAGEESNTIPDLVVGHHRRPHGPERHGHVPERLRS
ncbi:hypothetical protein FRIGORI9N_310117 [Frigoribacterium sp. 9N]|nr:hypothetical protein FRIGORI9N_310117 [Frigoribacterium sp. 9N]